MGFKIIPSVILVEVTKERHAHETIIEIWTYATAKSRPVNVLFHMSFIYFVT